VATSTLTSVVAELDGFASAWRLPAAPSTHFVWWVGVDEKAGGHAVGGSGSGSIEDLANGGHDVLPGPHHKRILHADEDLHGFCGFNREDPSPSPSLSGPS